MFHLLNAKTCLVVGALMSLSMSCHAVPWGGSDGADVFSGAAQDATNAAQEATGNAQSGGINEAATGGGDTAGGEGAGGEDITRREMLKKLIKHDATERFKEYALHKELLFMESPGTIWALKVAKAIGDSLDNYETNAQTYGEKGLLTMLKNYTRKKDLVVDTIDAQTLPTNSPATFYSSVMAPFVLEGNLAPLKNVDAVALIQSDTIAAEDSTAAVQLMSLLTNPFPQLDPITEAALTTPGAITGKAPEKLARYFAHSASVGLSASGIGDIIARRTLPSTDDPNAKSLMQIMKEYGEQRFSDSDWVSAMGAASEPALLREIAQMQAYSIWMQYQQYRLEEQQVALLSSINANFSRMATMVEKFTSQIPDEE